MWLIKSTVLYRAKWMIGKYIWVVIVATIAVIVAWIWLARKRGDNQPNVQAAIDSLRPDLALDAAMKSCEEKGVENSVDDLVDVATAFQYGLGTHDEGQNFETAANALQLVAESGNRIQRADALAQLTQLNEMQINRARYLQYQSRKEREGQRNQPIPPRPRQYQQAAYIRQDLRPVVEEAPAPARVRNDTQNVHESLVVASVKKGLEQLPVGNVHDSYRSIMAQVPLTQRAKEVVDTMMANSTPLSAFNRTESEILSSVWQRIQHPENIENRTNLISMLGDQLDECYYDKHNRSMVCANGRVSRVVQTLERTDANPEIVDLRPKWAVEQEIQMAGASIYQKLFDSCSEEQKHANSILAEDSTPQQLTIQQQFQDRYREELDKKFQQDYKGLLTDTQIRAHVETLVEAI